MKSSARCLGCLDSGRRRGGGKKEKKRKRGEEREGERRAGEGEREGKAGEKTKLLPAKKRAVWLEGRREEGSRHRTTEGNE
jgi:hypothetical protein